MNSVPIDFCERVWAICKCCERPQECECLKAVFFDRKWNQAKEKKQLHFQFFIGSVAGKWKYGFCSSDNWLDDNEILSLDELMKSPNLMNMRVLCICVTEDEQHRAYLNHDIVDVEKLLNFVSCLSNEPGLILREPQLLDSYEGRAFFKWLEKRRFSVILDIGKLTPDYHKMLEAHRKSTKITFWEIEESEAFLERRLMSGDLRRASLLGDYKFPSAVLEQIVQNVLEKPEDYNTNAIDIFAQFDDSTREMLDEMAEKKLCSASDQEEEQIQYTFDKQKPIFQVQNSFDDHWCIYYL